MIGLPQLFMLSTLEKLVEAALRYDPATRQRLQSLEGRRLFVEIHQPEIAFMLSVEQGHLRLQAEGQGEPHATLEARSLDLLRQALQERAQWVGGPLRVGGQVSLIETLYEALRELDIDWEEPLSHWLGDAGAHRLGRGVRQLGRLFKRSARIMLQNSRDYLQQELGILPMRWEGEELLSQLEDSRSDLDRLQDRLHRLELRLQQHEDPRP